MGMEVALNLPKCRVRVRMSYRTYQSVGYGVYVVSHTTLTKVSGTGNTRGMYPLYTLVGTLPNTNLQILAFTRVELTTSTLLLARVRGYLQLATSRIDNLIIG